MYIWDIQVLCNAMQWRVGGGGKWIGTDLWYFTKVYSPMLLALQEGGWVSTLANLYLTLELPLSVS